LTLGSAPQSPLRLSLTRQSVSRSLLQRHQRLSFDADGTLVDFDRAEGQEGQTRLATFSFASARLPTVGKTAIINTPTGNTEEVIE
jgi:hypothetical protein